MESGFKHDKSWFTNNRTRTPTSGTHWTPREAYKYTILHHIL